MWMLIALLAAAAFVVLLARHLLLRRELAKMSAAMGEIHAQPGNRQLTIGLQQPELAKLAAAVNTLYGDMDAERAAAKAGLDEMRAGLAGISHDLRTPLTSVLGYLKLALGGGNTPEQQLEYLEIAYRKAESLNTLVGGLFELARLESGGYALGRSRLDAAALLAEELAGAYSQMEQKGLSLGVALPEAPLWIVGDEGAVGRVFGNLLQNMMKHGAAPLAVEGGREGRDVVFRFSNRADALREEDIPLLFGRFFTADRMRTGKDTGLGLAIAKEFMEQMGGAIAANLSGGILTFTLRWPAAAGA